MNKLVTLCAILLVAVCHLGEAYDFQDEDFNQILSSDLEEILDSLDSVPAHPRVRRDEEATTSNDEKCKRRHRRPGGRLCCAEETVDSLHDKEKELNRACFKEVTGIEKFDKRDHGHGHHKKFDLFSCEEVEKRKSDMICIQQCVGQKNGVLAADGSPKADELTSYLKENFAKESWFDSAAEEIVIKCLSEAKNATENPPKFYTKGVSDCNPSGATLKHCLFREVQLSCPADQIKDKASCERFQERIKKGMDVPPLDEPRDE